MIRLFRVFIPAGVVGLILSEFLLVSLCYSAAAFFVLRLDFVEELVYFLLNENGWLKVVPVILSVLLATYALDLYSDEHLKVRSRMRLLQDLSQVVGIALLAQGMMSYAFPALRLGRGVMLYGSLSTLAVLFAWRLFYSSFVMPVVGGQPVLLLGENGVLRDVAGHIASRPGLGLAVAGYLSDLEPVGTELPGGAVIGRVGELREVIAKVRPSLVVVGMTERRQALPVQDLLDLRFSGLAIEEAAATYERVRGRICTKELRPSQLIFSVNLGPNAGDIGLQNLLNFSVAIVGTALALPVMAMVAAVVKLTSPGPVLYRQVRVGREGRPFTVLKFRSMRADAEQGTGAVWAQRSDPRVTTVGKWLRRLRLDELPQFFNVLRGDMSLVGPRPERPEFVETLSEQIPYYRQRHCVKPGITGWAQINYKYGDTLDDTINKLEYDLYYIKHISPALDAYIIFHTLKTMILSRGAQ